jgi:galactose mutarotase-like enzyme
MPLQPRSEPYEHWVFSDPLSGDLLRLVPGRGGLVSGWRCGGQELLYFDAARFADPLASVRGGIPVLFPICGNLPGDVLPLPQGRFPMRQHGFARDLPWQLTERVDGRGVRLELRDGDASRGQFPFPFSLVLEYRLEPSALAIEARLEHLGVPGDPALPFSLGLHPYLAVSDPAGVRLEGLPPRCLDHLTMAEAATAEQLGRLGEGVDFLCAAGGPVRLVDPGAGRALTLHTTAPMDLLVVWSEPPRPMICLEPWTAPRGSLVSGERLLTVAPGEALSLSSRYEVEVLPAG